MICVPIMAQTTEAALREMGRCAPLADMVELRIDQILDLDLERLMSRKGGKLLVTNRPRAEGGGFSGNEEERVRLLRDAVALGADYVDIEVGTGRSLIAGLSQEVERRGGRTQMIVSYHDARGTPSTRTLRKKLAACEGLGAHIVKVVTLANSMEDNLRVLSLIPHARKRGRPIIAFCMGELGRASRAMAPLLGSCISFATLERGRESAPGQLTLSETRTVRAILESEER